MKRLILPLIFLLLFLCGCKVGKDLISGAAMRETSYSYTSAQVDSMCARDTLPEMIEWKRSTYYDYETKRKIDKYVYYKTTLIYVVEAKGSKYKITKREIL